MKLPKFTKRQLLIGGVILLLLIGVGVYLYLEYRKKKQAEGSEGDAPVLPLVPDNASGGQSTSTLFENCPNDSFPLKFGKCGRRVEQFQMYLIKEYGAQFSQFGVDGKWGEETETIAKKFIIKNAPFSISEDYFNKTGMGNYKTVKYG